MHVILDSIKPETRSSTDDTGRSAYVDTPYLDIRDNDIFQIAKRISDLAMRFGASASHVYELGSVERISGYDAER
jgi:hypothetical protein